MYPVAAAVLTASLALAACSEFSRTESESPQVSARTQDLGDDAEKTWRDLYALRSAEGEELPPMRWDHRPNSEAWTHASMSALDTHGAILPALTPHDVERYCPAYPEASLEDRKAFWAGMLSSLAKHESTWRADAVGGGGQWFGLVQIAPATARGYGCEARSGEALKDGVLNLTCAVRIMSRTVPRDGVVASQGDGMAADWGPFHSSQKHADIAAWTRVQPYCQAQI